MNWLVALHVIGAVFIIGPMAILPMTGLRAIREGNASMVRGLSRTVMACGWLTLVFSALGVAGYYAASATFRAQLGLGWLIWSVVLTFIGIALTLVVVVPHMSSAAKDFDAGDTRAKDQHYRIIAAVSGVVAVLFLIVAVLMVVR